MKYFIYILLLITIGSCGVLKKIKKETVKTNIKIGSYSKRFDSIYKTEISKSIDDYFVIPITKSNTSNSNIDSIVDAKVDEILSKLNFNKRSGDNQYQFMYNKLKRELNTKISIGKTQNTSLNKRTEVEKQTTEISFYKEFIKKTGIPIPWLIVILIVVFRKQLFWLIKTFFPVFKTTKIYKFLT